MSVRLKRDPDTCSSVLELADALFRPEKLNGSRLLSGRRKHRHFATYEDIERLGGIR